MVGFALFLQVYTPDNGAGTRAAYSVKDFTAVTAVID